MKIVIVEDDPGIRKELKQLLENAFYEAEIIKKNLKIRQSRYAA